MKAVWYNSRFHTQRRIGRTSPTNPSLSMTGTKTLRQISRDTAQYWHEILCVVRLSVVIFPLSGDLGADFDAQGHKGHTSQEVVDQPIMHLYFVVLMHRTK